MIDFTIGCLLTVIMREFAEAIIGSDGCECSQITFPLNRSWIQETSVEILYQREPLSNRSCYFLHYYSQIFYSHNVEFLILFVYIGK